MAAGVMRDWRDRSLIDSAGMELDRTLLVFDYLNGEPVSVLDGEVADPIGPSGAAAAFDRATFLSVGGFDERLFAYWEDVDLVLRLRRLGLRCALAREALGDHEHSATLGSGSARKNYLMGFGRGYVLRKWQVLNPRRLARCWSARESSAPGRRCRPQPRRPARAAARLSRGRRSSSATRPGSRSRARAARAASTLRRRARRRARLRSPAAAGAHRARDARRLPPRRHQRAVALAGGRARAGSAREGSLVTVRARTRPPRAARSPAPAR